MRDGSLAPIGRSGNAVEADETYYGAKDVDHHPHQEGKPGHASKRVVVSLVERGGSVRSFHVERGTEAEVTNIVRENVLREATLFTDESKLYGDASELVARHEAVKHSAGEYVRYERGPDGVDLIHTNSVEGYFSIFKRGMKGIYQHCSESSAPLSCGVRLPLQQPYQAWRGRRGTHRTRCARHCRQTPHLPGRW